MKYAKHLIICLFLLLFTGHAFGGEKIVKTGSGYQKVKVKTVCLEGMVFVIAVGNKKGVVITQVTAKGSPIPCSYIN